MKGVKKRRIPDHIYDKIERLHNYCNSNAGIQKQSLIRELEETLKWADGNHKAHEFIQELREEEAQNVNCEDATGQACDNGK